MVVLLLTASIITGIVVAESLKDPEIKEIDDSAKITVKIENEG